MALSVNLMTLHHHASGTLLKRQHDIRQTAELFFETASKV
jgi:hypothetical protein